MLFEDVDLHDELLDDYVDFQRLLRGLCSIGFNIQELNTIFDVVAAILHLGDVDFVEDVEDTKGTGVSVFSRLGPYFVPYSDIIYTVFSVEIYAFQILMTTNNLKIGTM